METTKRISNIIGKIIAVVALTVVIICHNGEEAKGIEIDIEGASDAMVSVLKDGKSSVSVVKYNLPKNKVEFLLQFSQAENPEVFWYPTSVSYTYNEKTGYVTSISWENTYDDFSEIKKLKAEFEKYGKEAVNVCFKEGMTELEKVISAHEYLTETVTYKNRDDMSFTAYSVLVRKEGVCQGYAYAFNYLMKHAGVECYYVSSSKLNHGWNIVCLDGKYYHVDVTSDDGSVLYNGAEITTVRESH